MTDRVFAITTYHEHDKAAEAAEEWKRLGIRAIGWSASGRISNLSPNPKLHIFVFSLFRVV